MKSAIKMTNQATVNQTAKTSAEVQRSCVLSKNTVSEKAIIPVPKNFNVDVFRQIDYYLCEVGLKGDNVKNEYHLSAYGFKWREWSSNEYVRIKSEPFAIVATVKIKDGESPAKKPWLEMLVDKMVEDINKIIASNVADIGIRKDQNQPNQRAP